MVSFLEKELGTYVSLTCRKKKKRRRRKEARRSAGSFLISRWGMQRPLYPLLIRPSWLPLRGDRGRKRKARTGKLLS